MGAQVWWRQHDNVMEEQDVLPGTAQLPQCVGEKNEEFADEDLLSNFTLKQYIASPETLYQIMYSMGCCIGYSTLSAKMMIRMQRHTSASPTGWR